MSYIHINCPASYRIKPFTKCCPDCKRHSWFIGTYAVWYGSDVTCLRCGRRWSDGEWMPLDFVPKSRQRSIESMKRRYRMAINGSPVLGMH